MESLLPSRNTGSGTLYMLLNFKPDLYQALYAVDIPEIDSDTAPHQVEARILSMNSPILAFPNDRYAFPLDFVQLRSKFYFLGGLLHLVFKDVDGNCTGSSSSAPKNLYVFDPFAYASAPSSTSTSSFLTDGTPMNAKKYSPMVFVAHDKMYVLWTVSLIPAKAAEEICFEVYDPDTEIWTVLPNPPCHEGWKWFSSAVVNTKVILATSEGLVFCFDICNNQWVKSCDNMSYPLWGRAVVIDDIIYGCRPGNPAITLTSMLPNVGNCDGLQPFYKHRANLQQDVSDLCSFSPAEVDLSLPHLVHLGNKRFCHVLAGNPIYPIGCFGGDDAIRYRHYVSFGIFKIRGDTFIDEHNTTLFSADFQHSRHFVINCRSRSIEIKIVNCMFLHSGVCFFLNTTCLSTLTKNDTHSYCGPIIVHVMCYLYLFMSFVCIQTLNLFFPFTILVCNLEVCFYIYLYCHVVYIYF